ncbi:hypothetical protein [Phnomibacter sp. MR]|uniref:hypothetical protein n=1 Tax=Phnomibacter sp. MR TaxID=3042318 RepID=UPI003A8088FD
MHYSKEKSFLLKNKLEKERQKVLRKSRYCLVHNCLNNAGGSHVFQRKGVLNNIADTTNHFYSISLRSVFNLKENDLFEIKRLGIDNCFKFPGFCNYHDNEIFKFIETHPIDFANPKSLQLFSYRTACLEYRNKEIYLEFIRSKLSVYRDIFPDKIHFIETRPAEIAIKDLLFYKSEFEVDLSNNSNLNYDLTLIELPLKRVCFSSALSIYDKKNKHTFRYDKYGEERTEPLSTSFLNYFPYNDRSLLIIATHKKYFCNWTGELIKKLQNQINYDKIISDLLTYRVELWGIATDVFESISADKINEFKIQSHKYVNNYNYKIDSEFNLF